MLTNKRFLALLLTGFLHHSLTASTPSSPSSGSSPQQVGSIDDLINHASETNLQFCCDISALNQLYQSPTGTSTETNTVGVINNTSNLTVDGNNFCFCLSEVCIESPNGVAPCFFNCTNTLTLKNFSKIDWAKLSQTMKSNTNSLQAAFISAKNISITDNSNVYFANSSSLVPKSNNTWQPGIIRAFGSSNDLGTLLIQRNNSVIFRNNQNKAQGIICGNKVQLKENQSVIFENNYSLGDGGAISCANASTSSSEHQNISEITVSENQNVLFRNNFGGKGGAFTCYQKLSVQNNGEVIFDNNRSTEAGGAIYANKEGAPIGNDHVYEYLLKGNQSLIFSRNISRKGPAIFMHLNNENRLNLFADKGDIVFLQNVKINSSNQPEQCCSIEFGGGSGSSNTSWVTRLRYLCATKDHSIKFFDPIKYETETGLPKIEGFEIFVNGQESSNNTTRTGNPDHGYDSNETYSGTILFSGSQIPAFIRQIPEKYDKSRTTVLPTQVNLYDGVLAIDKNTILKCKLFKQEGGVLSLSSGSEFHITNVTSTETTVSEIKDILLDLNTFDNISSGSSPSATITLASGASSTAFNGTVFVNNPKNFAFLDSFTLNDPVKFPVLTIIRNRGTNSPNQIPEDSPITINPSTGYSGTLTFEWENGTSNNKVLNATWTPTGYNCAPYFKTPTFLNTAWMGVAAAKAISSPLLPEKNSPFKHGLAGLSVDALISSLNIRPSRGDENLHFTGNGYSLGCFLGDAFSSLEIRFGKLDGQAFNQKFNEEVNSSYYLGNICSRGSTFKTPVGEVHSALSLSYAYGRNSIYASFSEDFFGRRLSFHSRNFLAELLLSKPLTGHGLSPLLRSASPFIKASFSLSKNPGCQEVELTKDVITRQILVPVHSFVQKLMIPPPARLRQYLPSTLYNLSISPGISSESISQWNIFPVALRVSAAFSVDPYRVNPKTTMMIIQNAFPIPIRGTSLARCSAEVASSFQIKLLPGLTSYVDYKGNFSTRNISNSLKLGSSLIF
ncbi:polymorphic outer membrane protein middle domain-containing protein [Chlamydiifrater volucris]|uniref:polymorphic outer membrane protein middle domain-containing protein n=1 Tax=Chlamydiifrater volucris TaxID=2681470 RepID=UPI001BCDF545|nr:polymorphic outer membrane protein middle domain-containing protein [Chlamydiifrater volucris]